MSGHGEEVEERDKKKKGNILALHMYNQKNEKKCSRETGNGTEEKKPLI